MDDRGDPLVRHALAYPFEIPGHSYAVDAGRVRRIEAPDAEREVAEAFAGRTAIAVVAAGSNASPAAIQRKLEPSRTGARAVALRGTLGGFVPVYSAHVSRYGSIPATLHAEAGSNSTLFCTFFDEADLAAVHRSEALGKNYGFYRLEGHEFRAHGGYVVRDPHCYVSLRGCMALEGSALRLAEIRVSDSSLPARTQSEISRGVHYALNGVNDTDSHVRFVRHAIDSARYRERCNARLGADFAMAVDCALARRIA